MTEDIQTQTFLVAINIGVSPREIGIWELVTIKTEAVRIADIKTQIREGQ